MPRRPLHTPNVSDLSKVLATAIGRQSARLELKWIQQELRGRRRMDDGAFHEELRKMVERRVTGEPLQYILGNQPFGPINIKTRPPTLIPRPETENWALRVASLFNPTPSRPITVLDLCTGTGCIPILLGHLWPQGSTHAYGVDISPNALSLAEENAVDHGLFPLTNIHSTTKNNTFNTLLADILQESFLTLARSALHRRPADVITSNPPYITLGDYMTLPHSVKNYEDPRALLGDAEDGLGFYRGIAKIIASDGILEANGHVVLEVGQGQARAVEMILSGVGGIVQTEIWEDQWGIERVVVGRRAE